MIDVIAQEHNGRRVTSGILRAQVELARRQQQTNKLLGVYLLDRKSEVELIETYVVVVARVESGEDRVCHETIHLLEVLRQVLYAQDFRLEVEEWRPEAALEAQLLVRRKYLREIRITTAVRIDNEVLNRLQGLHDFVVPRLRLIIEQQLGE